MNNKVTLELLLKNANKLTTQLKGIRGGSKQAAESLKATGAQLKNANTLASKVNGFRRARIELRKNALANQALNKKLKTQKHALAINQTAHKKHNDSLKTARTHYNRLSRALVSGKNDTAEFRAEFARARNTLERAQDAANKTRSAGQKLRASINRLSGDSRRLSQRQQTLSATTSELKNRLSAAGISSKHLGQSERRLRREADALNASYRKQQAHLSKLAQRRQKLNQLNRATKSGMNTALTGAAAGAGYTYAGVRGAQRGWAMLGEGMDFDKTMSKVQALTRLNKNSQALKDLRGHARELGANTSFSATDVAKGQSYLAMAGYDPKQIQQAMPSLLDIAKADDMGLGESADITSNILGGFKLQASQTSVVADTLAKAMTTSNTNLRMLGETMKYVGPVAAEAGLSLGETAAYAGALGNAGIQSSDAGTALRAMLLRLSAPTGGAADALDALGIKVADKDGNMRGMTTILEELAWATDNLGNTDKLEALKAIFGERPTAAMSTLLRQAGNKTLRRYVQEVNDNANEAAKLSKTYSDNLDGDIQSLGSAWADVKIQIFGENNKALRELTQNLTGTIRKLGAWAKANPELVKKLTKWAAAGVALTVVLGGLSAALFSLVLPLMASRWLLGVMGFKLLPLLGLGAAKAAGGIKLAATALLWLGRAAFANPVTLAIAAIAYGALLIYKNWDRVKAFFGGFWAPISQAFTDAGVSLKFVGEGFSWLGEKIGAAAAWFGDFINPVKATEEQLNGAASAGERLGKIVASLIKAVFNPKQLLKDFKLAGAKLIINLIAGMMTKLPNIKTALSDLGKSAIGWFGGTKKTNNPLKNYGKTGALVAGAALATPLAASIDTQPPVVPGKQHIDVGGDNVSIQITAAPGADSQQLAHEIERVMQERDRAKSRRLSAALHD